MIGQIGRALADGGRYEQLFEVVEHGRVLLGDEGDGNTVLPSSTWGREGAGRGQVRSGQVRRWRRGVAKCVRHLGMLTYNRGEL